MAELDDPAHAPIEPALSGSAPDAAPAPRRWIAVVEALAWLFACLATALAAGGLELVLLAPKTHELVFKLYTREAPAQDRTAPQALVPRIEALDLASSVELRLRRGTTEIVLQGVPDADRATEDVSELLSETGYLRFDPEQSSSPDPQALLRDHPALTLGLQAVVLIAFGLTLARLRVRPAPVHAPPARSLALGFAAGLVGFLCALVLSAIQYLLGWSIEEQSWLIELLRNRETLLAVLPFVVVVMPISEETLFRGFVFRFLVQRAGAATAYAVSAATFSAVHLHLPGIATYFVVGLLFAWVCRRTGSLLAPIAGHVTYNGLALGLSLLAPASSAFGLP